MGAWDDVADDVELFVAEKQRDVAYAAEQGYWLTRDSRRKRS